MAMNNTNAAFVAIGVGVLVVGVPSFVAYRYVEANRKDIATTMKVTVENESLKERLKFTERSLEFYEEQYEELNKDFEELEDQFSTDEWKRAEETRALRSEKSELEREIRTLQAEIADLENNQNLDADEKIAELTKQNKILRGVVVEIAEAIRLTPTDFAKLEREERKRRAAALSVQKRQAMLERIHERSEQKQEIHNELWHRHNRRMGIE